MEITYSIVIVLIILALLMSFSIGGNDETSAPLAAAGIIKFQYVLLLSGLGLAIGTVFFSEEVASTVGKKFVGPEVKYTIYMLLSVLISAIMWLIVGSFAGVPLSSTHSLFGSIVGVIITYVFLTPGINISGAFNWSKVTDVVIQWFLSPLMGFILTFIIYRLIAKIFLQKLKGLNKIEKIENIFAWALLIADFGVSIYTGGNSAEGVGILYALFDGNYVNQVSYWFVKILLGIFAFLGLYIVGRYVIKNLAKQTTDARPSDGFILQSVAFIILMVTTVMGIPISHSHVIVFCIIGLNVAQKKEVDYKGIGKMVVFWVLTFPIAALAGGLIYLGFFINGLI